MIDRIFKNWKTSLVGLLIIGSAIGAVFTGHASLADAGAFMVLALPFFFAKDPKSESKTKTPVE